MPEELWLRLRRALLLDGTAFEEFRNDASFTMMGAALAAAAVFLGGLGAFLWGEFNAEATPDGFFVDTVILGSIFTFLLWLAWFAVVYIVLTQVYRESAGPDALFRVFAVGALPLALGLLVFIPEINFFLALLSIVLTFGLTSFGLRAAFGFDLVRLMTAMVAGFALFAIVLSLLITVDNSFVTGAFIFEVSEDVVTKSYDVGPIDLPIESQ